MPAMKTNSSPLRRRDIMAKAVDGTKFEATVEVRLLEDGTFSIEVPEALVTSLGKLSDNGRAHLAHMGYARLGAAPRVYAKALDDGLRLLKEAADDYLSAEESTERVICYNANIDVSFWQEPDGTIQPNGCGREGAWWASKLHGHQYSATNRLDSLSFGVSAKVFDKITTKRTSGDTVRYEAVNNHGEHHIQTDPAKLLNSWSILDVNPTRSRQMPYTPEAALFFHELQTTICRMARSLDAFVGDEQKLKLAIEQRKQLLLG